MFLRPRKLDLLLCAVLGLPIAWLVLQLALSAGQLNWSVVLPAISRLTVHTIAYDLLATLFAFILALPAIVVLSRASRLAMAVSAGMLLCAMLQPPVVYLYGWSQFFRLTGTIVDPQSPSDILRCIFTLSTWLWPIPAAALGLALRSLDRETLDAARLDGAQRRMAFRQLVAPIAGSAAITLALALQQFTVFEQTNIPVVATEARTLFSVGSIGGSEITSAPDANQAIRTSAAAALSLPVVVAVFALILVARRLLAAQTSSISFDSEPIRPQRRIWPVGMVLLLTLGIPLISMRMALAKPANWSGAVLELYPQISGSFLISGLVATVCLAIGVLACVLPLRVTYFVSVAAFLAGGQLLALGVIHILNRPSLTTLYDSPAAVLLVHVAMFLWISLLPSRLFHGDNWRDLGLAASADGANRRQYLFRVALPTTWRWHVAAALVVFCLSFGEIPAVMLLQPQRPQMLVPMLMSWVHMLRYDAMIEGALVLAVLVFGVTAISVLLLVTRRLPAARVVLPLLFLLVTGCGRSADKPDEVWQPPAIRPLIYPRGIAYSKPADEFFVVDRVARIQRISSDGRFINEWQMPEQQNGRPTGISVGPDGNVYVADTHYYRVMVYSPEGKLLRQFGRHGTGPGEFLYLTDVAFDSAGRIYVSEYGDNDRIQVFSPAGDVLYQIGRFGTHDGEFARPQSMVIEGNTLYITDAGNHRLVVFTTDGKFLRNMGKPGSDPGEFRFPYGLDQDLDGNLIVTEFGNNRVQKINKETGAPIGTWGHTGRAEGELAYPWASAVDKRGRVVVVDSGNNRLQLTHFR